MRVWGVDIPLGEGMIKEHRTNLNIKAVAHFDDGFYTIENKAWIKCDKDGNIKEHRMTKDDALKKLDAVHNSASTNELLLNKLEALGLIKFDKPEVLIYMGDQMPLELTNHKHALDIIYGQGYRIVKA